jgi:hypothetical protein
LSAGHVLRGPIHARVLEKPCYIAARCKARAISNLMLINMLMMQNY